MPKGDATYPAMTIDECLAFADEWSRGVTLYPGAQGWRVVCMLLADEVRAQRAELDEQCRQLGMGSEREARLMAQLAESQAREQLVRNALECALEFAGTVGPGSSWWDDVWPAYDGDARMHQYDDSALREMVASALDEVADEPPINGNELAQVRVRMKAEAIRARKG